VSAALIFQPFERDFAEGIGQCALLGLLLNRRIDAIGKEPPCGITLVSGALQRHVWILPQNKQPLSPAQAILEPHSFAPDVDTLR
jgi:hypothetical protein